MNDKEKLLQDYRRNIESAKDEMKYYFSQIKYLKHIINKNQLMINALESYQLPISFL